MDLLAHNGELTSSPQKYVFNHRGYGVFETFLAKVNSKQEVRILGLEQHLDRLVKGCSSLDLTCLEPEKYFEILQSTFKDNQYSADVDLRIRVIVYEKDWFLQIEPYQVINETLKLQTVGIERVFPEVKSCSALPSVQSEKIAKRSGFDEALLIDRDSYIRECSWGNFFWIDAEKRLKTPASKILKGVTRDIILEISKDHFEVCEADYKLQEFKDVVACFTSRSTNGVSNILQVDDMKFEGSEDMVSLIKNLYWDLYGSNSRDITIFKPTD